MKTIRIQPKEFISERFIMDYVGYNKKKAIELYRNKFPQFMIKELLVN